MLSMKYNCPLCRHELAEMAGESIHPGNSEYGVSLWCPNHTCSAQDVSGHGRKAKDAYEVIVSKFTARKERE